ncbi:MAG TPA: sodium:solute symporter family protein [Phycisphaeraceae bacterium]
MNLTWIDWTIVGGFLGMLLAVAAYTRRYTRSVSDFLAANRCAGRYLLTLAESMAGIGVAFIIASFEKFYAAGFAASWWGFMLTPISLIIALSGWVLYRYRETRAMTMAQFFEMRYSRNFRVYAGVLAWVSGALNYGIFPLVTARFFISFCGLPDHLSLFGFSVPTLPLLMAILLTVAVSITLMGGMIAVMITDFLQAQFLNVAFVVILGALLLKFSWPQIETTLKSAPAGRSMLNPFDQANVSDFNFVFFLIFAFKAFYNCLGWQGTQGYNCSAKTPHEAKMARVLAEWRNGVTYLMLLLMPICAYVLLHHQDYAAEAEAVRQTLGAISDSQAREQMTVPVALSQILPIGVIGLFAAGMVAAAISTDDTYLHSWGSIFIQDVILPFRRKPLTPRQHLFLLRISIVGIACFAFCFSLLFPLRDYLFMYFLATGTIYLGGSGAVIIGGLYWKHGTTAGAWAAMTTGWLVALCGIVGQVIWPGAFERVDAALPAWVPVNGAGVAMSAYLLSIVAYVSVSLITRARPFNLDRMLHRGEYALPGEHAAKPATGWAALGITGEFTRGDKIIYYAKIIWVMFWFLAFVSGTAVGLTIGIPDHLWASWWLFTVVVGMVSGLVTTVWFLWGGFRDMIDLFRDLNAARRDEEDNGAVAVQLTHADERQEHVKEAGPAFTASGKVSEEIA